MTIHRWAIDHRATRAIPRAGESSSSESFILNDPN
jgi:hypothetical protein